MYDYCLDELLLEIEWDTVSNDEMETIIKIVKNEGLSYE